MYWRVMGKGLALTIIVVVLVIAAAAAVSLSRHKGSVSTSTTTTSAGGSATPTTPASTTSSQQAGGSQASPDIPGTWKGSFTTHHWKGYGGSGEWTWIIRRTGEGSYVGVLETSYAYPTQGYVNITVRVEGDKITVGTVGGEGLPAVTFTGKLSSDGRHAEGTWKFTNGMDYGEWRGDKVSSSTTLTYTATQTSTPIATQLLCSPNPPETHRQAYDELYSVAVKVFGGENLECTEQQTITAGGTTAYIAEYTVKNYNSAGTTLYEDKLTQQLEDKGWKVVLKVQKTSGFEIHVAKPINIDGKQAMFAAQVQLSISGYGKTSLSIAIAPAPGQNP
jgi:hypothetical protein